MTIPYLPPDLSTHGGSMDSLNFWVHVLMLLLLVGWGVFFVLALVKFRERKSPKASHAGVQTHTSSYLEALVALFECVLLFGLSIPLWKNWADLSPPAVSAEGDEDVVDVRVIGQQFRWNVHYPGADGEYGRLRVELMDDTTGNPIGLDPEDPRGADDIVTSNQLIIPKGRKVRVNITTKDVIHSFSLPAMRVKQDAIPGESIPVAFTATQTSREHFEEEAAAHPERYKRREARKAYEAGVTTDENGATQYQYASVDAAYVALEKEGRFANVAKLVPDLEIACAQLCGGQHYRMVGQFHIVDAAEFDAIQSQTDFLKWYGEHIRWRNSP